jgi:chromate reductase, NAD(P)H dehydrogenase (quinone)
MDKKISVLGFAGSLRKDSLNKALLRAAVDLVPEGVKIEVFDLAGIPVFSQDLEGNVPRAVTEFKDKIRKADAILIATPEYNYSMPGVLKNAIDWASRPYGDNAFDGKPLAIMSASVGMLGGARAQYHLRQSCVFLNLHPLNAPEVMVPVAQEKVDAKGRLTDEKTRARIRDLLEKLAEKARKMQAS